MQVNTSQRAQILCACIALFFALFPFLASASPIATVQSATGASVRRRSLAAFSTLSGRTPLNAGDAVRTGPRGKANLLFFDGSQVRLNANTTVEITSPTNARGGRQSFFRALAGEVYARMRPGSAARSRTAVAGVRGTEILLQVGDDDTTTLTVIEGVVDFYNELGAVVVNASEQSTAAPGRAPSTPITVQNPGLLIEWTFDLDFIVLPREKFWVSRDPSTLKAALTNQATPRNRGDILFDLHRYEEALAAYQQAEQGGEYEPGGIYLRIGYALLELGRLDEAEAAFRRALGEQVASRPMAKIQLIASDDGVDRSTLRAESLVGLAWVYLTRNRLQDAQKRAEQAVVLAPKSVEALTVLGIAQLRQGNSEAAIQNLQTAREGEPATWRYQAQAWLALALLARDDQTGALREARAAVNAAPDSALARGHLALALLFGGNAREAARDARRAAELNPDSVAARVALAQALLARGESDAAAREAAVAAALDPSLPQAQYVLGLADAARRDYSHAARELQSSVRIAPEFLPAVAALARVYTLMGREGDAVTLLTDFQNRHPNSPDVLAALGQVYYQQGKYRVAAEQYQKAVAIQPQSALYQAELARLLLDDNQLNAALRAAQRAVFMAPQVGQYHALLGLVADFSGLVSYADREYRTAIALDPQNALARARLAFLDPTARIGLNTRTQAFLLDPAISRQLFRGGVDAEITGTLGTNGGKGISIAHRYQSDNGKFYSYGAETHGRSDGERSAPNDESKTSVAVETLTIVPNNRTNILLDGTFANQEYGYNGPANVNDDRYNLWGHRGVVAARHRIGGKAHLWLGGIYDTLKADETDRNADSRIYDLFLGNILVSERTRSISRIFSPEVRLDYNFGSDPERPTILTAGAAYARSRSSARDDLTLFPANIPVGTNETDLPSRIKTTYVQLSHRANDRLSFVAQLRQQQIERTYNSKLTILGTPFIFDPIEINETRAFPSLLVNYQLDQKTALRFFANRRGQDATFEAFAPTESLLASEASVLPVGFSAQTRLYELDAERYFSPRSFGKIFAFHSRSDNLLIGTNNASGNLTVNRATRTGLGVRFERQLNQNLFANILGVYNRTEGDFIVSNLSGIPNRPLDGDIAPYQPRFAARFALNYVDLK
jgi:tetratricopeptide (TPR) repeat protein